MPRLTDTSVRSAPPGSTLWDSELRGFGVRTGKASKTFVVLVGSGRRHKLGRYPLLTLARAREKAREKLAEITLGADHAPIALKALQEKFLAEKEQTTRPRTHEGYKWLLGRITLPKNAASVTTRQLSEKLDALEPSVREHATAVYKMLFRFAVKKGYLKVNPTAGFSVRQSKDRERTLTPDELKAVWNACPDDPFGWTVQLLILTGQRRSEPAHMTLEGDIVTIPGEHTKNHRTHTFPVGDRAQKLLEKELTYGGWSKAKARLDKVSGVKNWTLHDLRRTFATVHGELGTPPHIVEALINHVSGEIKGVARIYQRYKFIPEMREAMKAYSDWIERLINRPTSTAP